NWIFGGSDTIVCEGTSYGEHKDGSWRADVPEWGAGRWCDVFEIRDFLIQRVFIYLDPDYAGKDTDRYPWLAEKVASTPARVPPLSVPHRAPIAAGSAPRHGPGQGPALPRHPERPGRRRYWVAEHHNMPGIASAATSVVIGHLAGGTSTIRVGAGGIMLPNHA